MMSRDLSKDTFLLDHVPRIEHGVAPITVAWMGGEYHERAGRFMHYPEKCGFNPALLMGGISEGHDTKQTLKFLQSWLFFGLLKEGIGNDIEIEYDHWIKDYNVSNTARRLMISPYLGGYLDLIYERSRNEPRVPWAYWDALLKTTHSVAEAFDTAFSESCSPETLGSLEPLEVTWSLLMFGQVLTNTLRKAYTIGESDVQHWSDGSLLKYRMKHKFQCPHTCNKLMALFSMDAMYYLTLIPFHIPDSRQSALPAEQMLPTAESGLTFAQVEMIGLGRHWSCSTKACLGQKLDEKAYKTKHVPTTCKCDGVGPRVSECISILDDKTIPVFSTQSQSKELGANVSVVVDRASKRTHVAFSHVWADGLGNKLENKLPNCQAVRLAKLASTLTKTNNQPFWIDTFGIPRELEQRKKAIALMNTTYSSAGSVLVLDGGLEQHQCYRQLEQLTEDVDEVHRRRLDHAVALELLCLIACCLWTSRLWTLPEGMLGPELHFQFSDGTVELGDLIATVRQHPQIGTSLYEDIMSILVRLRPKLRTQSRRGLAPIDPHMERWPQGDLEGQFTTMFQALEFRDTTWKEDEAICLAIHLNLNLGQITSRNDSDKLEALFAQLDLIPTDLMFTHGDRISRYPYRWAPLHLLESKDNYNFVPVATSERGFGVRTDKGLLADFRAFKLNTRQSGPINDDTIFFLNLRMTDGITQLNAYGMAVAGPDPSNLPHWIESKAYHSLNTPDSQLGQMYILLGPRCIAGPPAWAGPGYAGLLVSETTEEEGCLCVVPLQTVVIFEMPLPKSGDFDFKKLEESVHWRSEEIVGAFCVG